MTNLIPIKTVILKTFKLVFKKEYILKFAIIGIVYTGLTFLINYLFSYLYSVVNQLPSPLTIISLLLITLLYIYYFALSISFIYHFCLDVSVESPQNIQSFKKYLLDAFKSSLKVTVSIIIFGLILFVGSILLFVPAVIWGVKYFFAPMISSLENKNFKEALFESKTLVKGHYWQIMLRLIVFYLVSSFPGMILSLINQNLNFLQIFFLPISSLFYVVLFNNLRYKNQNTGYTPNPQQINPVI